MELEERINSLEHEMKTLKDELHRTLLEIQEQVLIHYYPELRAEETSPAEGFLQSSGAIQTEKARSA